MPDHFHGILELYVRATFAIVFTQRGYQYQSIILPLNLIASLTSKENKERFQLFLQILHIETHHGIVTNV